MTIARVWANQHPEGDVLDDVMHDRDGNRVEVEE
jgi:hypothetical protein